MRCVLLITLLLLFCLFVSNEVTAQYHSVSGITRVG